MTKTLIHTDTVVVDGIVMVKTVMKMKLQVQAAVQIAKFLTDVKTSEMSITQLRPSWNSL